MQDHLEMTCAELKRTQTQLSNTQETTRNLEKKVEALQRQIPDRIKIFEMLVKVRESPEYPGNNLRFRHLVVFQLEKIQITQGTYSVY